MTRLAVLKERIAEAYDADELVDLLDISSEELLEAFEEKLEEKRDLFHNWED